MPDDDLYDDDQNDDGDHNIRQLRKKAREADRIAKEAEEARRELAFYKAGIPLDHPMAPYFVKGYDGEDFSPEAIKAAAVAAGLLDAPSPQVAPDEQEAHQRMLAASAGSALPPPNVEIEEALAQARTPEEVHNVMVRMGGWTSLDQIN